MRRDFVILITARALEAVEMSAGSYGKKELGGKARGLRERMEGS